MHHIVLLGPASLQCIVLLGAPLLYWGNRSTFSRSTTQLHLTRIISKYWAEISLEGISLYPRNFLVTTRRHRIYILHRKCVWSLENQSNLIPLNRMNHRQTTSLYSSKVLNKCLKMNICCRFSDGSQWSWRQQGGGHHWQVRQWRDFKGSPPRKKRPPPPERNLGNFFASGKCCFFGLSKTGVKWLFY